MKRRFVNGKRRLIAGILCSVMTVSLFSNVQSGYGTTDVYAEGYTSDYDTIEETNEEVQEEHTTDETTKSDDELAEGITEEASDEFS